MRGSTRINYWESIWALWQSLIMATLDCRLGHLGLAMGGICGECLWVIVLIYNFYFQQVAWSESFLFDGTQRPHFPRLHRLAPRLILPYTHLPLRLPTLTSPSYQNVTYPNSSGSHSMWNEQQVVRFRSANTRILGQKHPFVPANVDDSDWTTINGHVLVNMTRADANKSITLRIDSGVSFTISPKTVNLSSSSRNLICQSHRCPSTSKKIIWLS